jgi:hypothetical protein
LPGGKRVSNSKLYPRKVFSGISELRLIQVVKKRRIPAAGFLSPRSSPLFFLAGFRVVTLFFPFADGAEGRALESEFFS